MPSTSLLAHDGILLQRLTKQGILFFKTTHFLHLHETVRLKGGHYKSLISEDNANSLADAEKWPQWQ